MGGVAVDGLDRVEEARSWSAGRTIIVGKLRVCQLCRASSVSIGGFNNRQSRGHEYYKIVPPAAEGDGIILRYRNARSKMSKEMCGI